VRGNNDLKKSSNLDTYQEENFQTSSKILNPKIFEEENYQTSSENFNPRIAEERLQTSLVNSTPVDCKERSNQISLRNTIFLFKGVKRKKLLKSSKKYKTLKD